ncbi:MAG: CoA transferase [Chloroflexi bacterium]|nr:CoA transferase [Chloroflexota bacterium]
MSGGALKGVRVLEVAQAMAIPMAGQVLADMGADVIKVEPPAGDAFRHNQHPVTAGESRGYTVLNRGKRGICVDVTRPEGAELLLRLAASADIVLMSLKPSDLPRYGLTYADFRAVRADIIVLEHVPLGAKGPLGGDGGYDVVVQGISGIGAITARSNGDAPVNVRPAYADVGTGFLSALAVVAALRHRDLTGEGQRVETSLLLTALALGNNLVNWFAAIDPPVWERFAEELAAIRAEGGDYEAQRRLYERRMLAGAHGNIYFRHYRTKDGFVSVGCLSPALNARLRAATGLRDPRVDDAEFDMGTPDGYDALSALLREAEDLFRTRTTADWIRDLRAGGVPCGPFNFPHEVFSDPQVLANEFVVEIEHPLLGPYQTFAPPLRMDATPTAVRGPSPLLDQHTDEVLREAGYDAAAIAALRAAGIAGALPP